MKILVVGMSSIGFMFTSYLSSLGYEVTIIDKNSKKLNDISKKMEVLPVVGDACLPEILKEANIKNIDILLSVTNNDQVNLVVCRIAKSLFNVKTAIISLMSNDINNYSNLFSDKVFAVDHTIMPELIISEHIDNLLNFYGACEVFNFSHGIFKIISIKASNKSIACGKSIDFILRKLDIYEFNPFAIFRGNKFIKTTSDTVIEVSDEILFIAKHEDATSILDFFRGEEKINENILIGGCNNLSLILAKKIEKKYKVKLIDKDPNKCSEAQKILPETLVINSNIRDPRVLQNEYIEHIDTFISCTTIDEVNLIVSLLAKQLGASSAMSITKNEVYNDFHFYKYCKIDTNIYIPQVINNKLFYYLQPKYFKNSYLLRDNKHQIIEILVDDHHGDLIGKTVSNIKLPDYVTIISIFSKTDSLLFNNDTLLTSGDRILFLLLDKSNYLAFKDLFQ